MSEIILKDSQEVSAAIIAANSQEQRLEIAQQMINSGVIPSSYSDPAAVVAACEMGAEIGMRPYVALNNIHVIQGRPTLSTNAMIALVQAKGVAIKITEDFKAFKHDNDSADVKTTVEIYRKIKELDMVMTYTHSKTWNECDLAGLTEKSNWKKMPW